MDIALDASTVATAGERDLRSWKISAMVDPSQETAVIVCGLATIDLLTWPVSLSEAISPGVLQTVDRIEMSAGGCVSNAGIALSRLGIATAAITTVGNDPCGRVLRDQLTQAAVDCRGLTMRDGVQTAVSNVLVDRDSARSFLFCPGVAQDFDMKSACESLRHFPRAKWLLFGYYSLFHHCDRQLPTLFAEARRIGLQTALDTAGSGGGMDPLHESLPLVDLYLPSYDEAAHQTGLSDPSEMIDYYRDHGANGILGIKLGARGSIVSPSRGQLLKIAAIQPAQPIVDTTGAGDAYVAGFIAALVRKYSVADAARIASSTAACSVTQLGATAGIPSWTANCRLAGINDQQEPP